MEKDKQIAALEEKLAEQTQTIKELQATVTLLHSESRSGPVFSGSLSEMVLTGPLQNQLASLEMWIKDEIKARRDLEAFTGRLQAELETANKKLKLLGEERQDNAPWSKDKRVLKNVGLI